MNKDCKKSGPLRVRLSTEKKLPTVRVGLFSLREKAPTKNGHCYSRAFFLTRIKRRLKTRKIRMWIQLSSIICWNSVGVTLSPLNRVLKRYMPLAFPPIIAKLQCFDNSWFKRFCPKAYLSSAIFIILSIFTIITSDCMKTSSFISLTFQYARFRLNFQVLFQQSFYVE